MVKKSLHKSLERSLLLYMVLRGLLVPMGDSSYMMVGLREYKLMTIGPPRHHVAPPLSMVELYNACGPFWFIWGLVWV